MTLPRIDTDTDILIVGGGIMGCSLAYWLAREGREVALIDRYDLNTQASGTNAGSIHVQILSHWAWAEEPEAVRATQRPLKLYAEGVRTWRELAKTLDTDIEFSTSGGLMIAETEREFRQIEKKVQRENEAGINTRVLDANEVRKIAPYLSDVVIGADFCPDEGKLNPIAATPAIARGAEKAGARIFRHAGLLKLERSGNRFTATTARGDIRASRVICAAGGWSAEVAAMLGVTLPVTRRALHMNATEAMEYRVPHLIQHMGRRLTLKQASNGTMLIGGGWAAQIDEPTNRAVVQRSSIHGNLWVAQHLMPELGHLRIVRTWSGIINVMADGLPVMGEVPNVPGFYIASTSVGYTSGPGAARLISELVLGRKPSLDISAFAFDRFMTGPQNFDKLPFLIENPSL